MDSVFFSLKNACTGLIFCFQTQRNMVIHGLVGTVVITAGLILQVGLVGMLFLLTAVILVLSAEAFNTSVEKVIDLYTNEHNHLAHTAKDVAAGAVLLTSLFAVAVGFCILGPPLWQLVKTIFSAG
jgi:diacylglycerol kinase